MSGEVNGHRQEEPKEEVVVRHPAETEVDFKGRVRPRPEIILAQEIALAALGVTLVVADHPIWAALFLFFAMAEWSRL